MNRVQHTKQVVRLTLEGRAFLLFQAGAVCKVSEDLSLREKNPSIKYVVIPSLGVCSCIDFERTGQACKHVIATQIFRTNQTAAALTAAKIEALNKMGAAVVMIHD